MNIYEIVKKLIGPIMPIGETNSDADRLKNLEETFYLVTKLIYDLKVIAELSNRPEFSLSNAGKKADQFLTEIP